MQEDVEIKPSLGFGKNGKQYYFVRPLLKCDNKSRRVCGHDQADRVVRKWYYPKVVLYKIDGHTIGSNSKQNALKEYWRICELEDVGKEFHVEQL